MSCCLLDAWRPLQFTVDPQGGSVASHLSAEGNSSDNCSELFSHMFQCVSVMLSMEPSVILAELMNIYLFGDTCAEL